MTARSARVLDAVKARKPGNGLAFFLSGIVSYFENKPARAREELDKSIKYASSPLLKQYAKYFLEYIGK